MRKVVAFPTRDGENLEKHFGHSDKFVLYTIENGEIKSKELLDAPEPAHGAAAKFLKEKGVDVVVTGHIGSTVFDAVKANGGEFILGIEGKIEELIKEFLNNALTCKGKEYVHVYTTHCHNK